MGERSPIVESAGTLQLNNFHRQFLLDPLFFGPPFRTLVGITWRGEGCRYMTRHDPTVTVEINCKKGATTENQRADVKYTA